MRFNAGEQYLEKISHEVDNLLEMKKQMENPDIEEIDKPVFTLSIMDRIKNLLENPSNLPQYSAMAAWQQLEEELETGEIEGTLGEPYPPNFQITSAVQLFEQLTLHPDQCYSTLQQLKDLMKELIDLVPGPFKKWVGPVMAAINAPMPNQQQQQDGLIGRKRRGAPPGRGDRHSRTDNPDELKGETKGANVSVNKRQRTIATSVSQLKGVLDTRAQRSQDDDVRHGTRRLSDRVSLDANEAQQAVATTAQKRKTEKDKRKPQNFRQEFEEAMTTATTALANYVETSHGVDQLMVISESNTLFLSTDPLRTRSDIGYAVGPAAELLIPHFASLLAAASHDHRKFQDQKAKRQLFIGSQSVNDAGSKKKKAAAKDSDSDED